ncbi:MAG: hypothetical protein ACPGSB_07435 [Opitutales bacterium]
MNPAAIGLRLVCFGASSLLAIYLSFLAFEPAQAVTIVRELGYWLILAAVVLLLWQFGPEVKSLASGIGKRSDPRGRDACPDASAASGKYPGRLRAAVPTLATGPIFLADSILRWRSTLLPVVFLAVLSWTLWMSQPREFKVVMDEPVLALTSMQMHLHKEVLAPMRAYEIEGVFLPLAGLVDKRPLFFPFLLSVLHDLTGYRPNQGIWLNALLLPVFLGQCFWFGRRIWGLAGAYLAVGLFATVPLLAMVATSGGFDLLNLVMLLFTFAAAERYLRDPVDRNLNILILSAVLLAQTRYESVLFVFAVATVVVFAWWRQREIRLTWTAVFVPLLLVSYPLQRLIMNEYEGFWQMPETVARPFALSFIPENLGHAYTFFFALNLEQPNSLFLSVAFLFSLPILALAASRRLQSLAFKQKEFPPALIAGITFAAVVLVNFIILLSYHWGQADDIMATRLVLPFILVQVFVVVLALPCLPGPKQAVASAFAAFLLVFFLSVTRPTSAQTNFIPWGLTKQTVTWLIKQSEQWQGKDVLFITDRHLIPILYQSSALTTANALSALPELELHQRMNTFNEILVVYTLPTEMGWQRYEELQREREDRKRLEKAFKMTRLAEDKLSDFAYIRLMRVDEVRLPGSERIGLQGKGIKVDYTGKMDVSDPAVIRAFVESLPQ